MCETVVRWLVDDGLDLSRLCGITIVGEKKGFATLLVEYLRDQKSSGSVHQVDEHGSRDTC